MTPPCPLQQEGGAAMCGDCPSQCDERTTAASPQPAEIMALVSEYGQTRWSEGSYGATYRAPLQERRDREEAFKLYAQIEAAVAALAAVPAAAQEPPTLGDARRYQWLRSIGHEQLAVLAHYAGPELDKRIDAARRSAALQSPAQEPSDERTSTFPSSRDCPCGVDCFRSDCTDARCAIQADDQQVAWAWGTPGGDVSRSLQWCLDRCMPGEAQPFPLYRAALQSPTSAAQEPPSAPEMSRESRAMLLNVLWHHQGGSSPVGQPLRALLGIAQHAHLTDEQVAEAKWIDKALADGVRFAAQEPTARMGAAVSEGNQLSEFAKQTTPTPEGLTMEQIDALWKAYQFGQISADHTAKQVFAEVMRVNLPAMLRAAAPGAAPSEALRRALERIVAIENKDFGSDWEEIEEARAIANAALQSLASGTKGESA
jgi:hypothetical protein